MTNLFVFLVLSIALPAGAQTYVKPHVRKDGTYVEGHQRTRPNSSVDDNFSTKGNYNPYTGQSGTEPRSYERPYRAPSYTPSTVGPQCGYTSSGRYVCR